MDVKFFAYFKKLAGNTEVRNDLEADNLYELLEKLSQEYGSEFKRWVFPDERIGDNVLIMINGSHVEHLDGLRTKLKEDDVVAFFPKVLGG